MFETITVNNLLATMGVLIAPLITAIVQSLVEKLLKGAQALLTAASTAELTLGTTTIDPYERLSETHRDLRYVALLSGSLETTGSPEIIANDMITEVPLYPLLWSLGEHLRARVYHKTTARTSATRHRQDIKGQLGKTLRHCGNRLRTSQQPLMGLPSIQNVQL